MRDPYMMDDEEDTQRGPLGGGAVAARPGFNPGMGAQTRAPGDGQGPQPYTSMTQDPRAQASVSRAYGQQQAPAAQAAPQATAQQAAPAAAAAKAGGGMNPMLMGVIAQYMQGQSQKRQMGRDGQAQIAQQFAASTGYPQYGVQAAQQRAAMDDAAGPDYISEILKMQQQRGRGR